MSTDSVSPAQELLQKIAEGKKPYRPIHWADHYALLAHVPDQGEIGEWWVLALQVDKNGPFYHRIAVAESRYRANEIIDGLNIARAAEKEQADG